MVSARQVAKRAIRTICLHDVVGDSVFTRTDPDCLYKGGACCGLVCVSGYGPTVGVI
ncbi:hypothetical protein HMPREF1549_01836 [Actinomyces johnsonii F0510]|uniref:Uncharacterized protein n=1 Tax=Actinomyces johnsonii F0510 TaxID=1227262 RepID=U1Q737_9ACTO|nr:hypothetical protein HMPREF1549_01836 [Actinomyces johnsonii F0510]